jgi:hypothetical protein
MTGKKQLLKYQQQICQVGLGVEVLPSTAKCDHPTALAK